MISSGEESRLHEDLSSSLEDLVGNFDERINSCLKNPDVNTEDIAPVQVRTQDEVMAESQTWWTLTCNFGNIQPLDFDKSAIRRRMMPALDLKERKVRFRDFVLIFRVLFWDCLSGQPSEVLETN
ncbi:unnamed protein product [Haemonchus placei]|uniref:FEZ-like protein n=1 Tax=Haemonchus placei TaxID=6290 RepID=A0A0N4WM24_HAEPC|nr:unnamed protein product [Haemonchus placei]